MVIPVQITHYIPANYASQYDIAKYDRATREYYMSSKIHRQQLQTIGLDK